MAEAFSRKIKVLQLRPKQILNYPSYLSELQPKKKKTKPDEKEAQETTQVDDEEEEDDDSDEENVR